MDIRHEYTIYSEAILKLHTEDTSYMFTKPDSDEYHGKVLVIIQDCNGCLAIQALTDEEILKLPIPQDQYQKLMTQLNQPQIKYQPTTDIAYDGSNSELSREVLSVESASVAFDFKYSTDHLGIDGQHFNIPFDNAFEKLDIIRVNSWLEGKALMVTESPDYNFKIVNGERIDYWLHKLVIVSNETGCFHPVKYAKKGITYQKI
jgi:hypothetical protein